ncbi:MULTISPECIES: hypothetical protein [unclassified Mesorhizobium]|uniref:hypothetical protein n=1 Tax=unclassified Mesorhizobium TaxID=325217 RepID=UPI000FDA493E|nr:MULTISPECIES: hypothetical protein [unclassified Mesorhizobium]TGQ11859.1 hypothetical protein EN862_013080 [Mesorhizobium sp. M2E.F.Ca.ET.219.01.1.1]TGT70497.1 hypothetical protein EN809_021425 [Mesorhizobium sp. M2E.F.Ca.ET.166.01.1.1]TGV98732.1 hypothetical protein EN797_027615 [Mesorhizobium sp. M2E.F.Ca.ET.154.01.1.1]
MTRQSIEDRILNRPQPAPLPEPPASPPPARSSAWRLVRNTALLGAFAVLVAAAVVSSLRFFPALGEFVAGTASAQSQAPAAAKPTDVKPVAEDASGVRTPFQTHASQAGVHTCANLFAALGQALTAGSTYAIQTQWDNTSPDTHAVQAVAGMSYDLPDYKTQAAGVVIASPVGQSCEGSLVRVAPFQKSCQEVAQTLPKGSVPADNLSNTSLFNLANNGGQALLVPTGNTCIVVSVARMGG